MLAPFLSASTLLAHKACCSASPGWNIFIRAGKYGHLMTPLLQNMIAFRRCITWPQAHQWVSNLVREGMVNLPRLLEMLQHRNIVLCSKSFACCPSNQSVLGILLFPGQCQLEIRDFLGLFLWLASWKPEVFWAEDRIASVT